ncbi:MAG TPA: glycosyltransferase family 2 protein [Blastocatellia bacterium]|nr:glycosyltransferase family 2 protein [Blastocatellia bacterium]
MNETSRTLPLLSVVIVSWNTRDMLRNCLESIFENTTALKFEIIVVDNASADGSAGMLKERFPQVKVILNDSNVGFAKACNQGMRASAGSLILLLNSDTYVRDDVIARMSDYLMSRPEISMASCQLRWPDGGIQHSAFRSLSIWRSLFEDLWLYKLVSDSRRDDILLAGYWKSDTEKEVDWLAGAFMMLRREVFTESEGFSEDFFMYGEDSEWCMRIKRAGKRIFYAPIGSVFHIGGVSSDLEWTEKERLRLCHLGGLRAYAKVNGRATGFFYHMAKLFGSSARLVVYTMLAAIKSNDYYNEQKQLYSWLAEFYLQAFARRRSPLRDTVRESELEFE